MTKLIELKANINQSDHRGWTPLIISVYQNNEEIVSTLLASNCDIEKKDCVTSKQFGKQAIDRAKTVKMIELLKSALAKQRKSNRLKSPSRSGNSPSPSLNSSPRRVLKPVSSASNLKSSSPSPDKSKFVQVPQNNSSNYSSFKTSPRRNSADFPNHSPLASNRSCSLSRSPSDKGLSIDFRKQLREKIDKKTRERMNEAQNAILNKWQGILIRNVREIVQETDLKLRGNWKVLLEGKGKDVMSRIKEFNGKAFDVISKGKLQKKGFVDQVAGGVDELVVESISKFQLQFTDAVEKSLENRIQAKVAQLMERTQAEVQGVVGDFILQAFGKVGLGGFGGRVESERSGRSERSLRSENTEKSALSRASAKSDFVGRVDKSSKFGAVNKSEKSQFDFQGKALLIKPKMNTGKPGSSMPQMNIASTLQEFLKFEQIPQK